MNAAVLDNALKGDRRAVRRVVDELVPVIQARTARAVLTYGGRSAPRNLRCEVEDLTQDVLSLLFAQDGKVLRSWRADLGLSLKNFVGLVARRYTISVLRSGRRNPWMEIPSDDEHMAAMVDETSEQRSLEGDVASRQVLERVVKRLQERLSPLAWELFELLFVSGLSVPEVQERTGMSPDAVYAWRSRLVRAAKAESERMSDTVVQRRIAK